MSAPVYEAAPFRPGKSSCPVCESNIRILRPENLPELHEMPTFFLCENCPYVGQVGVKTLCPLEDPDGT